MSFMPLKARQLWPVALRSRPRRLFSLRKKMLLSLPHAFRLILGLVPLALAQTSVSSLDLNSGYRQMYNLQFEGAHQTFRAWEQSHPDDPLGPASDAAAYLFAEFDRLGVLQSELFVDDERLKKGQKLVSDPESKLAFEGALAKSEQLANRALSASPQDRNALFAKTLNLGMRGDYLGLIEKRLFTSLGYMKNAGMLAEKLLAIDPSYYDAYIAVGVENYILGSSPAPVRWMLRAYGAETDKNQGIQMLRLTAEKGHYLLPYARLLLAVAALRDGDRKQASEILADLAREFPNNKLYARELARLQ